MIPPSEYDRLCERITTIYEELDNAIIEDMASRIVRMGGVTEATKWQAKQLRESGRLYEEIIAEISKYTDLSRNQVNSLFEDAGSESIGNDNRRYRAAGLEGVVKMSDAVLQTLEAGIEKCNGSLQNLTLTTANASQMEYINACNQAYMQVVSGAFSYQEAIKQAVRRTAEDGISVLYPSGKRDRIEVAVRRSVLTGIGQTVRKISLINAGEMGCDLMEITAHAGARPEHARWQGKVVSLSGRRGYLSTGDIGYGTGEGFGGWNCRHDWFPFFEGISEPAYTPQQLEKLDEKNIEYNGKMYSQYEISQIQRRYEREIRAAKREQSAFKVAVEEADDPELRQAMQESMNHANALLRDRQDKMRDFIRQTGQDRDYFREQNYGKTNTNNSHIQNDLISVENNGTIKVPKTLSGYEKARVAYMEKIQNTEIMKPENKEAVEKALKTLIDDGDFCMRVRGSVLNTILDSDDRHFKNQMETQSSMGAFNPEIRKEASEILFGVDSSQLQGRDFEKYGFLAGKDKTISFEDEEASDYGEIIIQFDKNKLFDRTTFTVGDSLNRITDKSLLFAGKVSEPSVCAVPQDNFTSKTIETSAKYNNGLVENHIEFCHEAMAEYIELQYHGNLSLDDVEILYYQGNIDYTLKGKLEELGIKVIKTES